MKSILQCSLRCVQGLLEGMGGNAFWDGLSESLKGLISPTAGVAVAGVAATPSAPLLLPMAAGTGLVVGSLVLSHRSAVRDAKEKLRHEATLKILRKRTKASIDRFDDLDIAIKLTNQNFLIRLNELEELIDAKDDDERLKTLLETNESLFIALDKVIVDNHSQLKSLITDIDRDVAELGQDLNERLAAMHESQRHLFGEVGSIKQTGEDTNQIARGNSAKLDQILAALTNIPGDSPNPRQQVMQVLEQAQHTEDGATAIPSAEAASHKAVRVFAGTLAAQIADMQSTENGMNVRFFSIRETLREKFERIGVDVDSMLIEVERLREMFRSARFSTGGGSSPTTVEQLRVLRRNLHLVALEMAQFPTDLLERAAKHGVYYYQFGGGLSEAGYLHRLFPDALAIEDPKERWRAAAEIGLDPQHDEYGLENLGRMLRTTNDILSLSPLTFSDGLAQHGWLSIDDWKADSRCVLAFGCYRNADQTSSATASAWPSVLLFNCRADCSVSPIGCLVARHVNLRSISMHERDSGGFWMYARDPDYAYEWNNSASTPARVWSAPTRDTAPIFDVTSYSDEGERKVAVRRRNDIIFDDGENTTVIEVQGHYRCEPRLIIDETNSELLEVDRVAEHAYSERPNAFVPEYFRVQVPLKGATRFCVRMKIDDQAYLDRTNRPIV
ncbi:MAG: hypothetical protein KF841_15515 [Phycisphaerae bacterium]|nr:hypothetical protein [Phycisphaerae bacterium]